MDLTISSLVNIDLSALPTPDLTISSLVNIDLSALPTLDLTISSLANIDLSALPTLPTSPCGFSKVMEGAGQSLGIVKDALASLSLPTGGFSIPSLSVLASISSPLQTLVGQVKSVASGGLVELESLRGDVANLVSSLDVGNITGAFTELLNIQTTFPEFDIGDLIVTLESGNCKICDLANMKIFEGLNKAVELGETLITPLVDAVSEVAHTVEMNVVQKPKGSGIYTDTDEF